MNTGYGLRGVPGRETQCRRDPPRAGPGGPWVVVTRARPAATQDHKSYEALSWQRTTAGRATRRTSEISHAQAAGWFPKKNHV